MTEQVALKFASWDPESERKFDLFIAQCGYEPRSKHAAEQLAPRIVKLLAFEYLGQQRHAHSTNLEFFRQYGRVSSPDEQAWAAGSVTLEIREVLASIRATNSSTLHVGIDISSCDRQRIAALADAAIEISGDGGVEFTFVYSVGNYESATTESDEPVMINEPIAGFEGWSTDPDRPLRCVVGLGYEGRMAW